MSPLHDHSHRPGRRRCLHVLAALAATGLAVPQLAVAGTTYTFGVVPQFEQRKLFAIWKPLIDELARRTGLDLKLVVTLSVPEFEAAVEAGSFDFVYANPYHILKVRDSQGYIPLVRDEEALRGIIVVRQDSPLKSVRELDGKILAVPSPNAVGASLLVRAELERLHGVRVQMLNVKTHSSVYLHVLNGLTEAGGGVQKTLAEQAPAIQSQLRVLYTTRDMPSHPVAAHPRVPPTVRDAVRQALLAIGASPTGKALLDDIPMPRPVTTSLDDYLPMRQWGLEKYWITDRK
ncbi:MAG: phosphate/phosphite/phosphonate ABC transporter substrate-binding protein [Proteobacteria bacterium]|nr:phosphate/phosphite/phosphonate ABC transporter substrate-binding protein [Pseudomonadota bacterium]